MGWLATWFIFDLIGEGADPKLSESQGFKNVSLQMMIDIKHSLFVILYID